MNKTQYNDNYPLINSGRIQRGGPAPRGLRLVVSILAMAWCLEAHALEDATAVAVVTNGSLAGIVITDPGAGYTTPPAVTFVGGGGTAASAIAQVSNGSVSAINIEAVGIGYTSAPIVVIDPPPPPITPATLSISMVPKLVITGAPWTVQQVQYSSGLGGTNQWLILTNIVLGDSPYVLVDTNAPSAGAGFYQVVTLAAPGPDPVRWAWINPGSFTMGSPDTEYDRSTNEGPQTEVTLTNGFWIGRFELTQGEYTALLGTNYSYFAGDTNQPVEEVSWFDASNYCALLTTQEQAAGRVPAGYVYRLPTEAEWEYATRAGTTTRFFFGDDLTYTLLLDYGWISTNSDQTTHDGGGKLPNPWGLYDTSGNVWEWCADWYGTYVGGSVANPTGPTAGVYKVMRGGSWHFGAGDSRSADRNFNSPDFASFGIGFRVVLGPRPP
jgi:formylglycine-generating enzyme required for sulfatase activity